MQQWLFFLSDNPTLRGAQLGLIALGAVAVYLVCYTTRDILLRTRSFAYQLGSILLVALVPLVGFFLYLLMRPARTLKQREMERMLRKLLRYNEEAEIIYEELEKEHANPTKAKGHHGQKHAPKQPVADDA